MIAPGLWPKSIKAQTRLQVMTMRQRVEILKQIAQTTGSDTFSEAVAEVEKTFERFAESLENIADTIERQGG